MDPLSLAITHLCSDHEDQQRGHDGSEHLVSVHVESVGVDAVVEGAVRDEEEREGGADAVGQGLEELLLVEQEVLVTRRVQLGVREGVAIVHVLRFRREKDTVIF